MRLPDLAAPAHGDIHVWHVAADAPVEPAVLSAVLSTDEHARAAAFRQAADRNRFSAARAALRTLLGGCLGLPPAAVPLAANAFGKPVLATAPVGAPLHFNVSHSGARAVIALSRVPVGIDIEAWPAGMAWTDWRDSAAVACAPDEMHWLAGLAQRQPEHAMLGFLRLWTAKEACSKAVGTGLSASPQAVRVALPGSAECVPPLARAGTGVWYLHDAGGGPRYVACVATPLAAARVVHRQYPLRSAGANP
ncbi:MULTISPECIES: 4'-phosphopantetheinyl transferase superfamily protein [unclassified Cupriavidus]|uniref:4'-phosphopantetheinyl transferase family protein n=1 Tax=unclassified Cupriavidus TaxID=2640874 RepID=UPI0003FC1AD3|nr:MULTISPECIES: 4'-phosphopantetheinyl transferase superfamily protein [unclassified Cupriavidus]MBP0631483.1 4'-phosphopantetheinyl transferase superfamily protein [Cupriavidus sp. AcVe19-1a]MBP0637127.1 4'-phosphopantetheinyl transferase superfamily protein [Cupriavidus sp. AcVe19-6a]